METQQVVVLYEDPSAREQALRKCEHLARETNGPGPTTHWFSFALLKDTVPAEEALRKAAEADFVVFAMRSASDFSPEVKFWIERWLGRRRDREGALVGLVTDRSNRGWEVASRKEVYLRQVALRAGLDYLARLPGCAEKAIPNSLDSFSERAGQMTSVLDEILRGPLLPPPPF